MPICLTPIITYLCLEPPWTSSSASHNLKVPQYLDRDTPETSWPLLQEAQVDLACKPKPHTQLKLLLQVRQSQPMQFLRLLRRPDFLNNFHQRTYARLQNSSMHLLLKLRHHLSQLSQLVAVVPKSYYACCSFSPTAPPRCRSLLHPRASLQGASDVGSFVAAICRPLEVLGQWQKSFNFESPRFWCFEAGHLQFHGSK